MENTMGKRGKDGDGLKFPALSALRRRKKSKDYVDYDYVQKLSPEERAFLNQFTDEYYNGNSYKFTEPLLDTKEMARKNYLARQDIMNEFQRVEVPGIGVTRTREDDLVDAIDEDRPDIGIKRSFPVPATSDSPGTTGLGGSSRRPARCRPTRRPDGHELETSIPFSRLENIVSKNGHQKKRALKKAARLSVAAAPQTSAAGDVFRQAVVIMKNAMHYGGNALAVAQSIHNLEQAALAADAQPPAPAAAPLAEAPKPEGEAPNGQG
jgi:hypothetical protein